MRTVFRLSWLTSLLLLCPLLATAAEAVNMVPAEKMPVPFAVTAKMPVPQAFALGAGECPNCTTCQNGCNCAGGGYYCKDGKCQISLKAAPTDACLGVACNGSWASGTAVTGAPQGQTYIITNRHVVDRWGGKILHADREYPARLLGQHTTADLALVVVDAELPTVQVAETDPRPGTAVTLKGYGQRHGFGLLRRGTVTNTGSSLHVTIPHGPGDSGAAWLNDRGELVGVLNAGYPGTDSALGYSASQVRELVALAPVRGWNRPNFGISYGGGSCANGSCNVSDSGGYTIVGSGGSFTTTGGESFTGSFGSSGGCGTASTGTNGGGRVGIWFPGKRIIGRVVGHCR